MSKPVQPPEFDIERGPKYCPECGKEYEGWRIKVDPDKPVEEQYTPVRQRIDDQGRVHALCDDCVDRWEKELKKSGDINYEPTPRDKVQAQVPLDMEYPGEPIDG